MRVSLLSLAMIIGFTERIRTIHEYDAAEGFDLFQLVINVSSVRTSEREHPMLFRLLEASSNATVEPLIAESNIFDANFGVRANPDDPLEETRDLPPGERTRLLLTTIRNDLVPEDLECYSIGIFPVDVPGRRELFTCNEDSVMADNYFCEHTICIIDDGEVLIVCTLHNIFWQIHLELHLWRLCTLYICLSNTQFPTCPMFYIPGVPEIHVIRASVDALCRGGTSEISRDPRTKRLQTRRESLARPSKHTNNNL